MMRISIALAVLLLALPYSALANEGTLNGVPQQRAKGREVLAQGLSPQGKCTAKSLNSYRNGPFKKRAKENPEAAAKELSTFLNDNKCFESLAYQDDDRPENLANVKGYLWAISDLIWAHGKAKKFGPCLEIGRVFLQGDSYRLVEISQDKKIQSALEVNVKLCEKGRVEGLVTKTLPGCSLNLKDVELKIGGFGESGEVSLKRKPSRVVTGLDLGAGNCAGIVELKVGNEEIVDLPEEAPVQIPYLIETDGQKKVQVLNWINAESAKESGEFFCGGSNLTGYENGNKERFVLITSDFGYCHGGTARFQSEMMWKIEKGQLKYVDGYTATLH